MFCCRMGPSEDTEMNLKGRVANVSTGDYDDDTNLGMLSTLASTRVGSTQHDTSSV